MKKLTVGYVVEVTSEFSRIRHYLGAGGWWRSKSEAEVFLTRGLARAAAEEAELQYRGIYRVVRLYRRRA